MLAIGFKGGLELQHSGVSGPVLPTIAAAIAMSLAVPIYSFLLLRLKLDNFNAAAIAATYGSISAVTFITAESFLETQNLPHDGFMVAALALIVVPVVIRTTENMLALVPSALREAAYALGSPKWKVISGITLRAARAGVVTGVLLAVARISGETAPLLFTALNNQFWTSNLGEPMASLPVTIFKFAMSPYENWQQLAWAGVFLITVAVLGLNILARVVTRNKI